MDFKRLSDNTSLYRIVLTMWIISTIIVVLLLFNIDNLINIDLYDFGLQFSLDWAEPYWTFLRLNYVVLGLPMALSIFTLIASFIGKKERIRKKVTEPQPILQPRVQPSFLSKSELQTEPQPLPRLELDLEPEPELEIQPEPQPMLQSKSEPEVFEPQPKEKPLPAVSPEPVSKEETKEVTLKKPNDSDSKVISCPRCKKIFSRPLFMLDFAGGKTRLVNLCPYCNYVLGSAENGEDVKNGIQIADFDKTLEH